jgi:DNA-binding transcriptional ArsR family regulator
MATVMGRPTPGDPQLLRLSKELLVAKTIYEAEQRKQPLSFDELAILLTSVATRPAVSRALDALFDKGVVKAEWKDLGGESVRVLEIAGEANKFVRLVAENYRSIITTESA